MPTFAMLAGFEIPKERQIDGVDQTGLLLGKTEVGRADFRYGKAAIRVGQWKCFGGGKLYNLDTDIGERNDIAKEHPEIAATLRARVSAK